MGLRRLGSSHASEDRESPWLTPLNMALLSQSFTLGACSTTYLKFFRWVACKLSCRPWSGLDSTESIHLALACTRPNAGRVYDSMWRAFATWCDKQGCFPFIPLSGWLSIREVWLVEFTTVVWYMTAILNRGVPGRPWKWVSSLNLTKVESNHGSMYIWSWLLGQASPMNISGLHPSPFSPFKPGRHYGASGLHVFAKKPIW